MDQVMNTLEKMKQNSITSSKKFEAVCITCKKKFKTNDEAVWMRGSGFCNDECLDKYNHTKAERRIKKLIDEVYRNIPSKYTNIKTRKQDQLSEDSMFITGNTGTGKTVFIYSLSKYLASKGISSTIINFNDFILAHYKSFKSESKELDLSDFDGCLIIDDLGSEKVNEYVIQILYKIINHRYENELPMVISSNHSLSELSQIYNPRITSRIAGMCKIIKFTGEDQRVSKR